MNLNRRGWTLAEVLVVIAIVAALMLIVFSAASSVLTMTQRTACQSNLRQVGMAFMLYANENGGQLPAEGNYGITDAARSPAWFNRLPPYVDQASVKSGRSIFQCPSFKGEAPLVFTNATPKSYKMNSYIDNKGRQRHHRMATWQGESGIVLMVDAVAGETGMGQWGHAVYSAVDGSRHGGACAVCMDCSTVVSESEAQDPQEWKDLFKWLPTGWTP